MRTLTLAVQLLLSVVGLVALGSTVLDWIEDRERRILGRAIRLLALCRSGAIRRIK